MIFMWPCHIPLNNMAFFCVSQTFMWLWTENMCHFVLEANPNEMVIANSSSWTMDLVDLFHQRCFFLSHKDGISSESHDEWWHVEHVKTTLRLLVVTFSRGFQWDYVYMLCMTLSWWTIWMCFLGGYDTLPIKPRILIHMRHSSKMWRVYPGLSLC